MSRFPWLDGVTDWGSDVATEYLGNSPLLNPDVGIGDQLYGLGEAGLMIGSNMTNVAGAGLAGLGVMGAEFARGNTLQDAVREASQTIQDAMDDPLWVFEAETPVGKRYTQMAETLEAPLEAAGQMAGDFTLNATGSPALATAAMLGPEALAEVLFTRGAGAGIQAGARGAGQAANLLANNIGQGPRPGGPGAQEGSLKIHMTDPDTGMEKYVPRSDDPDTPLSVAEELVMEKPAVRTREADLQQETGRNGGAMFGSGIPESMRMIQRNTGKPAQWYKELARKGIARDEVDMFIPDLARVPEDTMLSRDDIFDLYEAAPREFIGVRRAGRDSVGDTKADVLRRESDELMKRAEENDDLISQTHTDSMDDIKNRFKETRDNTDLDADQERVMYDQIEESRQIVNNIIEQVRRRTETKNDDTYTFHDPSDPENLIIGQTFEQLMEKSTGRLAHLGWNDAQLNKLIGYAKEKRRNAKEALEVRSKYRLASETGGGTQSYPARSDMTTGYKYPGAIDSQTWLFNQSIRDDQPQGAMQHFAGPTIEGSMAIEGGRVGNLGHVRTERRPVFAETYIDPMTGETKWRDLPPEERGGDLFRPAAQHLHEGQSDTHQQASTHGYHRQLTPMEEQQVLVKQDELKEATARRDQAAQDFDALEEKWGSTMPEMSVRELERMGSEWANEFNNLRSEIQRRDNIPSYGTDKQLATLRTAEELLARPDLPADVREKVERIRAHADDVIRINNEHKDATSARGKILAEIDELRKPLESQLPELSLKQNSERFRFYTRNLIDEAVRNGDEYVTITSMRGQGEAYSYGGLGPEEGVGRGGSGGRGEIYYDASADQYYTVDGDEIDVDDLPDSVMQEAYDNAPDYDRFVEEAEEAWIDNRESELVNNGDVWEDEFWEVDGERFDSESEAETYLDEQWEEDNPPPDEDDFWDDDLDESDYEGYTRAYNQWEANREREVDYDQIEHMNMIRHDENEWDGDSYDVYDVAREVASEEVRYNASTEDMEDALGETWSERLRENAVEWPQGSDRPEGAIQLPDPDVDILNPNWTDKRSMMWGGSDGGNTERMAHANYRPDLVDKNLRRTLRDMGLSNDEILEALVRVNIDVSGQPGPGRQQNVKAIKMTDAVKRATQNKGGLFKYDPVRTHGKQPKGNKQGEMFGKAETAMERAERLAKQHDEWKKKNVKQEGDQWRRGAQ